MAEQVAQIARQLLEHPDELADQMTVAIQAAVPLYRQGVVDQDTLRTASLVHLEAILGSLGRDPATTSLESRENGRRRAAAGVPLAAILEAYRVGARFMWEQVAVTARSIGAGSDVVLRAGSEMWQVLDTYSQELADGYREEAAAQTRCRRAATLGAVPGPLRRTSRYDQPMGSRRTPSTSTQRPARRCRRRGPRRRSPRPFTGRADPARRRANLDLATPPRHRNRRRVPPRPSSSTRPTCRRTLGLCHRTRRRQPSLR